MPDQLHPLPPPPLITSNDRVLVRYAYLDNSVGFNAGHGLFFVDGVEIGPVPCLAICKDKISPDFTLYFCDEQWQPLGVATGYESIDAAMRRAERIYPRSITRWTGSTHTEQDAIELLDDMWRGQECNFCGKRPFETSAPFFGDSESARICGECIAKFSNELRPDTGQVN